MTTDLSELHDSFFEECDDHLAMMEEGLLQLESRPNNLDLLGQGSGVRHEY